MSLRSYYFSVLCAIFFTCLASPSFAVDGVILIDQNRALAGNVTPGDAPGFPVTISQPGSYRLSGNLTVPSNTDGIVVEANDVTLDLNGFRLTGAGASSGITDRGVRHRNITIRNGTASQFDFPIAMFSEQVEVRDMRVFSGAFGIRVSGDSAVVTGNNVFRNNVGILIEARDAIVTNNIATQNNVAGIDVDALALVSGNNASNNALAGIQVDCPSNAVGNIATRNGQNLVTSGVGCTFSSNNFTP